MTENFSASTTAVSRVPVSPCIGEVDWIAISESAMLDPIRKAGQDRLARLSPREMDVLRGVVVGHPNKTIAGHLKISIKTIEKHRGNVMRKLGIRTLPDLMRIWIQAHPHDLRVVQRQRG